jgi:hypothetical protein
MFRRETGAIGAAEQEQLQPGASFTDPNNAQAVGDDAEGDLTGCD